MNRLIWVAYVTEGVAAWRHAAGIVVSTWERIQVEVPKGGELQSGPPRTLTAQSPGESMWQPKRLPAVGIAGVRPLGASDRPAA